VRASADGEAIDEGAEAALERVIAATQAIRSWRDDVGVKPGATLSARLDAEGYSGVAPLLGRIARLDLREHPAAAADDRVDAVASVTIPGGTLRILDGVDRDAHAERLARERKRLEQEVERLEAKLANEAFVANAPAPLVAAEREKLARLREQLARLDLGGQ